MPRRTPTRRNFMQTALAGGAASLTVTRDLFAQSLGPLVIGHHCDLTGVISSWGFWHDRAAKGAVELVNQSGGIAGRIVDCYISRVENGKFEVKKRIPKEEIAANMPLRHDLPALPI